MALTLQMKSLLCNMLNLLVMKDESEKVNFPVTSPVTVDFLGITHPSILC